MSDLDQLDYYTLLGVEPRATDDELKRAFRKFALRYHPDRFAGADAEKIERATTIYRRGSEAIEVLGDPAQRKAYDAALARGQLRLTTDPSAKRAQTPGAANAPSASTQPTVQSPAARAFYAKALDLQRAGDARGAWRAINQAIEHEPDSPMLEEALRKIERSVR